MRGHGPGVGQLTDALNEDGASEAGRRRPPPPCPEPGTGVGSDVRDGVDPARSGVRAGLNDVVGSPRPCPSGDHVVKSAARWHGPGFGKDRVQASPSRPMIVNRRSGTARRCWQRCIPIPRRRMGRRWWVPSCARCFRFAYDRRRNSRTREDPFEHARTASSRRRRRPDLGLELLARGGRQAPDRIQRRDRVAQAQPHPRGRRSGSPVVSAGRRPPRQSS